MSGDREAREQSEAASCTRITSALRSGATVADSAFDAHLPVRYRWVSERHWTPIAACRDAAVWLAPDPAWRVLDVGSGVGKLCVAGALMTGATFVGIEQRPHLVEIARDLSHRLDAASAVFICDDAFSIDWRDFTSLYFFNPFAEALSPSADQIDSTVEQTEQRHKLVLARLADKLADLGRGTRVVVYHDLGCPLPEGFSLRGRRWSGHGSLELWVRK